MFKRCFVLYFLLGHFGEKQKRFKQKNLFLLSNTQNLQETSLQSIIQFVIYKYKYLQEVWYVIVHFTKIKNKGLDLGYYQNKLNIILIKYSILLQQSDISILFNIHTFQQFEFLFELIYIFILSLFMSFQDHEDDDDYIQDQITLINRIAEQYHIEWINQNYNLIQNQRTSINYKEEYQQIINEVVHYIFDEDQYDLIDEEYLQLSKVKQVSSQLQQNDFQKYLQSQFEILKKNINKFFFQIYQEPQLQFKIKDKYKVILIGGTKDFIYLILIQPGIIINNKCQRCRIIIILLNQQDFSIFKRFEENVNYKLYAAQLICNYDLNQIGIYTNQVFCLYDANNQIFIQYETNNTQNLVIFYQTTMLQLDSNTQLNQLNYENQVINSRQINSITPYQQPYSMILYKDILMIYFNQIVKAIYCKNGKQLYIKRNLTTIINYKESCISNRSNLIYQSVKFDAKHTYIYQLSLNKRKILRKFDSQETSDSTDIYLIKHDKVLVAISYDQIEAYETVLGKQVLYLHKRNEMASMNQQLQIVNSQYLLNLNYSGLNLWRFDLNDMEHNINQLKQLHLK
ncbi:unnamed protein product (macronuclear) [Paramecium tetraurelia]|uniref:Transmembrane protein n=1 Tax=Paramecium tetraurelia TaxID=5888 RepID=A0CF17_PARTE|nr:uncharacterized protein GSPATT00037823001 [Paramecium tetraurelia]CAK69384.1 unnamed protein product [Paramecium tetraurelia]|eukprot:XP_001436781.1 hypothetical protein (macronuclear) [Paramecium tetraurelia strain d4-2]